MTAALASHPVHSEDAEYRAFMKRFQERFSSNMTLAGPTLFTTDAEDLFDAYIAAFPAHERQHHACNACRRFINTFGRLVTIDEQGRSASPMWNESDAPELYAAPLRAMRLRVERAQVTGVFRSSETRWGTPITGDWAHFALVPPAGLIHRDPTKTAFEASAAKKEERGMLLRALADYTPETVAQALRLLESEALYRIEKVIGVAKWLAKVQEDQRNISTSRVVREQLIWRAVALAPAGFTHVRSSMIGTLLDDIKDGMGFEDVSRRFADKMHPLKYQRPQAAPKAGNIAQGEKLIETLGLAPSLERRIARLDEVPKLWEPTPTAPPKSLATGGVFGHLTPKGKAPATPSMALPAITMTLEKFVRTVIPNAEAIEVSIDRQFVGIAITTAVNPDAPKLFQWDHSFAHYVWQGGVSPASWGLAPGWIKVAAVTRLPARWNDDGEGFAHHGDGLILLLDGAHETRNAGNALFPEQLRGELREVRATIEAYSRGATMHGMPEGSAVGVDLRKGAGGYPVTVRVKAGGNAQVYKIDRWD